MCGDKLRAVIIPVLFGLLSCFFKAAKKAERNMDAKLFERIRGSKNYVMAVGRSK